MSRLTLNKATLHQQSQLLKRYRQYLPSLDLKRKQLIAEKNKALTEYQLTREAVDHCLLQVEEQLPMLADERVNVEHLISIKHVETDWENIVGVNLPRLKQVAFNEPGYSFFCKPHWVDEYIALMQKALSLQVQMNIEQQRLDILEQALKKVTQRVNLFDKVLIPKTLKNIRKIQIYLSDNERAAIIRAKITKQKRSG